MWYKNGGLICDIVVSPEKKRNQQSISSDYWFITMFFWQIQSASFPLNPPWCAPFYHGTNPQINFLFLVFFLMVPYWQHVSQGLKNNLLVAWQHPAFFISRILPPKMLESPTLKAFGGGKATKSLYQAVNFFRVPIQRFSFIRFPLVRSHHPLAPVTCLDRPCCRFGSGIGKMYQKAGESARCPNLK